MEIQNIMTVLTLYTLEHAAQGVQYEQELQQEVLDTHSYILCKRHAFDYIGYVSFQMGLVVY